MKAHLVMDTIDRVPQTGAKGIYLKQQLRDKLIEHEQYADNYGQDLPEIRQWKWQALDGKSACSGASPNGPEKAGNT